MTITPAQAQAALNWIERVVDQRVAKREENPSAHDAAENERDYDFLKVIRTALERAATEDEKTWLKKCTGIPALYGFCEPVEGYAERPEDLVAVLHDMGRQANQSEDEKPVDVSELKQQSISWWETMGCSFSKTALAKFIDHLAATGHLKTPSPYPVMDGDIEKGSYVLATKYTDGDPFDHWCVGYYDRLEGDRHHVLDADGNEFRLNGFRRVGVISDEYGEFLIKHKDQISVYYDTQQIIGSLWDSEITVRTALASSSPASPDTIETSGYLQDYPMPDTGVDVAGEMATLLRSANFTYLGGDYVACLHPDHVTLALDRYALQSSQQPDNADTSYFELCNGYPHKNDPNHDKVRRYRIEHDGFVGTSIGYYKRLDGYEGTVLQQDGTKVVHVYGNKWLIRLEE